MKWILIAILVTKHGVTELQSDFDTLEKCQEAKTAMLMRDIDDDFVSLTVRCELEEPEL
jgi:hypothetical protein